MSIAIDVQNRLDLPICDECQMAEIEVDHDSVESYGGFLQAIVITVTCEHRESCKRATLLNGSKQLEAMQDDGR